MILYDLYQPETGTYDWCNQPKQESVPQGFILLRVVNHKSALSYDPSKERLEQVHTVDLKTHTITRTLQKVPLTKEEIQYLTSLAASQDGQPSSLLSPTP